MNCVELQASLAEVEDGRSAQQRAHLRACPACSALLRELDQIVAAAAELQAADEPSPRVWNSIAIALRNEGLIRPQRRSPLSSFGLRWGRAGWLLPACALLLLTLGLYLRQQFFPVEVSQQASFSKSETQSSSLSGSRAVAAAPANSSGLEDEDLLQEVAANEPAMKPQYEESLRTVNASILDLQGAVNESPNDAEARRALMDAYQQKSMLFEMAMDRSLP
jgi:hypothetical protein